jgi:hypothetical protein
MNKSNIILIGWLTLIGMLYFTSPSPANTVEPGQNSAVTLGGVVTGSSGASTFNSTNAAGNTMNNAFIINNSSGNNSGHDLEIMNDPTDSTAYLFLDGVSGSVAGFVAGASGASAGVYATFGTVGPTINCFSAAYSPGGVPNWCTSTNFRATNLRTDTVTNTATTGPPSFTNGLTSTAGGVISSTGGAIPTATCSGGSTGVSIAAGSTNNRGQIVTSSSASTNCTVTWSAAATWPQAPFCVVSDGSASITPTGVSVGATGTSTFVIDFASATSKTFNWVCM